MDCVGPLPKAKSGQMKEQYDRKAMLRQFKPGNQVLVLSPVPGSALSVRFLGPYVVDQKVSSSATLFIIQNFVGYQVF